MNTEVIPWTIPLEYFGAFRFSCTVIIATWIFVRGIAPRRNHYVARVVMSVALMIVITISYPIAYQADRHGTLTDMSMMSFARIWIFAVFLSSLFIVKYCRVISWTNALSRWALGLCAERFITAFVHNWLFLIIVPDFRNEHPLGYMMVDLFSYALFLALAALLLAPIFRHDITNGMTESRMLIILYSCSFLALAIISNISMHISEYWVPHLRESMGANTGFDYILWFSTSMAGVTAIVIFLFQYAIYHTGTLHQETAMLNLLAEQKEQQYATLRDNIEFINHKTHDLKHQVAALAFSDDERRNTMVREVQQSLNLYDSSADTGNSALDTLITERNFYCTRNGIRLSTMLKGCDWATFDVVDLFTLFGNALDNAFEYVSRFDDPDKRVVSLTAQQHGNLIAISVDNYFEGTVALKDGLPATTKADALSHGLGLKSIRRIARQYGGDIQVDAAPPVFTLRISLVLPRLPGR